MGTNSALLCKRVIDNAFQVMSVHFVALTQATDYLKIADKLASTSRAVYDRVRAIVPLFVEDTPFYEEIASVENYLRTQPLNLE